MGSKSKEEAMIIGIDHGFSLMKHTHGVFSNGLKKLGGEATLTVNSLKLDEQTYKIGEGRLPMKDDKTQDEDYYILTVAAICKELKARGVSEADVILAVGLPFSRFGAERVAFRDYLKRDGMIEANFDGEEYSFGISDVYVYPQCYAAVANRIGSMDSEALVVDIGSKTIDIIHFLDKVPQESTSTSWSGALIECTENIKNEVYSQTNRRISETQIQTVMTEGDSTLIPDECVMIIRRGLHQFVDGIEARLHENGFETDMIPVIYVGGGAGIMRRFHSGSRKNVTYIEDIRANAIGYEYLCNSRIK